METATLAGGCFWCTEAVFKRLKGVESVEPGYAGGQTENPTYEEVSSGKTGHAETVQIKFDPKVISFEKLLEVFWKLHDPTTLNRQGNDVGTQYRSAIFYQNETQKQLAEKSKQDHQKDFTPTERSGQALLADPIVTEILPLTKFYPAEAYHDDYYEKNRDSNAYCRIVIDPKIQKLYKEFKTETKPNMD